MYFAVVQPFGDPPDEINRFKVVDYICRHGVLPHGADPEVILAGYGASYAFQPILTYIIQGFLLRFLKLFTEDSGTLLLAARMEKPVYPMDVYASGGLPASEYIYSFLCEYGFYGDAVGGDYILCAAQGEKGGFRQEGLPSALRRDCVVRYVLL